jgi:hypothetical protein
MISTGRSRPIALPFINIALGNPNSFSHFLLRKARIKSVLPQPFTKALGILWTGLDEPENALFWASKGLE